MKTLFRSLILFTLMVSSAFAQTSPNLRNGQVPTAGQWNGYFMAKQDTLGFVPLNTSGGTMFGPLNTYPSSTLVSGLNIPPGTAPLSPINGDIWETSAGIFAQVNGATVGPLSASGSGSFAATSPLSVSFPSSVVTYACTTCAVTTNPLSQFAATTSSQLASVISNETGTNLLVFNQSPTILDPTIGGVSGTSSTLLVTSGTQTGYIQTLSAGAVLMGSQSATNLIFVTNGVNKGSIPATTADWLIGNPTVSQGTISLAGATSGSVKLTGGAAAVGTWTFPNATDTVMGNASTATMTNKTFDTAGTGNSLLINGVALTANAGTGAMVRATSPSISGLTVTGSFTATGLVTNASLANSSLTVNGTAISLGGTGTVTAAAGTLTGTALNATVISSSLTSVGTLTGGATGAGFTVALGSSTITGLLGGTNGGTGVNNGANTITLGGSLSTAGAVTHAGAFASTITVSGVTNSTLPSGTHTLAGLDVAQTWAAAQNFGSNNLRLNGATSGVLNLNCASICGTGTITFPAGTTDFSATGGAGQFLKQVTAGAALTVGTIAAGDLPVATTGAFGAVKPDGTTITISGGVITASGASATAVTVGTTNIVSGASGQFLYNNAGVLGNQALTAQIVGSTGVFYRINTVPITTTSTYTPSTGFVYGIVECVGGGGGGGGATSTGANNGDGGGGGAGSYCKASVSAATMLPNKSVTIGGAGTAGASTPTNGGSGGSTSFGALCTTTGGQGGVASSGGNVVTGGPGGSAGTGNMISRAGDPGGAGLGNAVTSSSSYGGSGAGTVFGAGGQGGIGQAAGGSSSGFGSGGGGGASFAGSGAVAGAAGQAGYCFVTEYLNQ